MRTWRPANCKCEFAKDENWQVVFESSVPCEFHAKLTGEAWYEAVMSECVAKSIIDDAIRETSLADEEMHDLVGDEKFPKPEFHAVTSRDEDGKLIIHIPDNNKKTKVETAIAAKSPVLEPVELSNPIEGVI